MTETFFGSWQAVMLEMTLKSLLLFAVMGLALLFLRRASAAARHLVCLLALAGFLLLPLLTLWLPSWRVTLPSRRVQPSVTAAPVRLPAMGSSSPVKKTDLAADLASNGDTLQIPTPLSAPSGGVHPMLPAETTPATEGAPPQHIGFFWSALAFSVWLAGMGLLMGLAFLRLVQVWKLGRQCSLLTAPRVVEWANAWSRDAGLRRPLTLLTNPPGSLLVSPVTWGYWRPVVLLPAGAEAWPEARLRAVLLHEFAHILRGDWQAQILASLVCACGWFHPLVWLTAKRMRMESERACDDRVLMSGMTAQDYAAHLLAIVRFLQKAKRNLPAAVSMAQPSQMEGRLKAILDARRSRGAASRRAHLLAALLAVALLLPLAIVRVSAGSAVPRPVSAPPGAAISASQLEGSRQDPSTYTKAAELQEKLQMKPSNTQREPAEPAQAAMSIAWGKPIRGLQAGLRFADSHGSHFFAGEYMKLEVLLRNVGKRALTFTSRGLSTRLPWSGMVENDTHAQAWRDPDKSAPPQTMTLAVGEERVLPGIAPIFHILPMGNSIVTEPTLFLESGKRTIRAFPFLTAKSRKEDWLSQVQTGTLDLEVMSEPPHITIPPLPEAKAKSPLEDVEWGTKIVSGLQAGIRIEGERRRFSIGDKIPLTAFIRNTNRDREVAFAYTYQWPDAWDAAGKPISTMQNQSTAAGIPGAVLLILKPGETLLIPGEMLQVAEKTDGVQDAYPALLDTKPGKYRLGQGFFYGLGTPGSFINGKRDSNAALKEARERLDNKQSSPYEVTILSHNGETRKDRAVVVAAHSYNILAENRPHETPLLNALAADPERLWTGTASFEIVAKGAPPQTNLPALLWGKESQGLQAGIHLIGNRRRFTAGETVPLECYIRNVSDHDIVCSYQGNFYSEPPTLETPDGKTAETKGVFLTGIPVVVMQKLQPGETMLVPHTGLTVGTTVGKAHDVVAGKRERGLEAYPYMEQTEPGRYRVGQSIRTAALAEKDIPNRPPVAGTLKTMLFTRDGKAKEVEARIEGEGSNSLNMTLTTGKEEFAVVAKGTLPLSGRGFAQEVEKADGASGIAWNNVRNGLDSGARFHNGKSRYSQGETIQIDYLIRNTSTKPITFGYSYWAGVTNYSPRITDGQGNSVPIITGPYLFKDSYDTQTLNPGEMIAIGHSSFKLYARRVRIANGTEAGLLANPGKYKISLPGFWNPDNDPKKTRTMMSAPLEFEVVSKDAP